MPTTRTTEDVLEMLRLYTIIPTVVGGAITLLSVYLGHRWQAAAGWKQTRAGELTKLYSRLIAVASDDLERAKNLEALLITMPSDLGEARTEWIKEWLRIDADRHIARPKLFRICFQARLLERDKEIKDQIHNLGKQQLFFSPAGTQNYELFKKRWDEYKANIEHYERLIQTIGDCVALKYGA